MIESAPVVLMTDWVTPLTPDRLIASAIEQGYDGVEVWWPGDARGQAALAGAIADSGAALSLLAGSLDPIPAGHIAELARKVQEIADSGLAPLHVTLHAGRDFWDDADHDTLAAWIVEARGRTDLDILVEMHRSRMLYSAHSSRRLLERHPGLRVTFDVSHWLTVAESMLDDQPAAVDLAIARADHIHARIGHPQGPQVNDPEAAEWGDVVERHLAWWDRIVQRMQQEGRPVTFLAEFGPVDYAPSEPGSRMPLRDPEAANRWMQRALRERFGRWR